MELTLKNEKTGVTSFDGGFKFLGVIFLKSLIMQPFAIPGEKRRMVFKAPPLTEEKYRKLLELARHG